ncbi:MAG: hypothetical protein H7249_00330 [Chitinophagaceae bacterium]|nr:hypothetical protein [Oligoflexus sp.]
MKVFQNAADNEMNIIRDADPYPDGPMRQRDPEPDRIPRQDTNPTPNAVPQNPVYPKPLPATSTPSS